MANQITTKTTKQIKKSVNSSIKKLKLIITVINRSKALYYTDLLEQFEINMQTVIYGRGTADKELFNILNVDENEKAILLSVVREDQVQDVLEILKEKFQKIKNGKGIAFTIPMKSIIGVSVYQFLSNNTTFIKEEK